MPSTRHIATRRNSRTCARMTHIRPYPLAKYAALSSTRQRNMINRCTDWSERYGKDGAARRISAKSLGIATTPDAGDGFLTACTHPYSVRLGIPLREARSYHEAALDHLLHRSAPELIRSLLAATHKQLGIAINHSAWMSIEGQPVQSPFANRHAFTSASKALLRR